MANETIKPVIQNKDALVQNGFLSPEFASSLNPAQPVTDQVPAILEDSEPLISNTEFTPNAAGNTAPIERIKSSKTGEESAPDMSNFISVKEPIVEVAQDVVLEDVKQQEAQQLAESNARIAEQQKLEEMNLEKQVAAENAVKSVAAKESLKQKAEADQIQLEIDKEQEELKNFSIDDIVKNRTTGDSILASLAVVLGGIGAGMTGSNVNQGLQAVNAKLDREFDKQKLGMSEKLAKKRRVLDLMNMQLKQRSQQTDDAMAKQRMQLMSAQIDQLNNDTLSKQIQEKQKKQLLADNKPIPASLLSPQQLDAVNKLRSEYNTQTQNLGSREILGSLNKIQNFTKKPSPAGDLGLVFEYMKILDPKSTVREGEFALAAQTGSIPERIVARYNKLLRGETLSEAQRQDFAKQAQTIASAKLIQQKNVNQRYSNLATQFEVPSTMILENFDINTGEAPTNRELMITELIANGRSRSDASATIDSLIAKGKLNADKYKK